MSEGNRHSYSINSWTSARRPKARVRDERLAAFAVMHERPRPVRQRRWHGSSVSINARCRKGVWDGARWRDAAAFQRRRTAWDRARRSPRPPEPVQASRGGKCHRRSVTSNNRATATPVWKMTTEVGFHLVRQAIHHVANARRRRLRRTSASDGADTGLAAQPPNHGRGLHFQARLENAATRRAVEARFSHFAAITGRPIDRVPDGETVTACVVKRGRTPAWPAASPMRKSNPNPCSGQITEWAPDQAIGQRAAQVRAGRASVAWTSPFRHRKTAMSRPSSLNTRPSPSQIGSIEPRDGRREKRRSYQRLGRERSSRRFVNCSGSRRRRRPPATDPRTHPPRPARQRRAPRRGLRRRRRARA